MKQLSEQMSRLQVDRPELESEQKSWEIVERRLNDLEYWCETQAKNLAELDYDQKRLALFALKLNARVWRSDHDPRFENTYIFSRSGYCRTVPVFSMGPCTAQSTAIKKRSQGKKRTIPFM